MKEYRSLKYANRPFFLRPAFMAVLLLLSFEGIAGSFHGVEKLQIHGFISQGYALTSDNNLVGDNDSEHGSLNMTEIGLNATYQHSNYLSFALQGLYRNLGEVDEGARIDYATIDWTAASWESSEWGIRLGRVKNPMGFYNETRDVAFTRPSIILPQGIYYGRSRNLLHSTDGGQLYLNIQADFGFFELQGNAGRAENDNKELKMAIFGFDTPGELVSKETNYWGRIKFDSISGDLELALSYADVSLDYKPGQGDPFAAGNTNYRPIVVSARYSWPSVILTAEYLRQRNEFSDFGSLFPDVSPTTESYYLQGEYRFNRQFQGVVRFDTHYLNKDDRYGKKTAQLTGGPAHRSFTEDWVVGLRWSPNWSWQVQAEYHRVNGTSWLSGQANPDPSELEKRWNLFTLMASFRF